MAEAFKRAVSRVSACLRHHLAFSRRPHTLSRHQLLLFCGYLLPLFLTCSQSKQSVFLCVCSASNFTWVDRRSHLDDMENKEAEKNICIYCKYVSTEYLLVPSPPLPCTRCTAREGERPPATSPASTGPPPSLRKQEIIVGVFSPESECQQNSAQLQLIVTNNQGRGAGGKEQGRSRGEEEEAINYS